MFLSRAVKAVDAAATRSSSRKPWVANAPAFWAATTPSGVDAVFMIPEPEPPTGRPGVARVGGVVRGPVIPPRSPG
jgi:hypothetical protein